MMGMTLLAYCMDDLSVAFKTRKRVPSWEGRACNLGGTWTDGRRVRGVPNQKEAYLGVVGFGLWEWRTRGKDCKS